MGCLAAGGCRAVFGVLHWPRGACLKFGHQPGSQALQVDMVLLLLQCVGAISEVVQPITFKATKFNLLLCWDYYICIWSVIPVVPSVVGSMSGIRVMEGRESVVVSGGLVQSGMGQQFMGVDCIVHVIDGTFHSLEG